MDDVIIRIKKEADGFRYVYNEINNMLITNFKITDFKIKK